MFRRLVCRREIMSLVKTAGVILAVTFFYLLLMPFSGVINACEAPWYNDDWTKRIPVSIDYTEVNSALIDFPVYVDMSTLGSDFFSDIQSDGDDIRITTSDGVTELPFDLVVIGTSTETGELHFKADVISPTSTTKFYIYFGNATATAYTASDTYGRNAVWTNYEAVYHLEDLADSTGNGNTLNAVGSPTSLASKLGKGYSYPGSLSVYHKTSGHVIDMNSSLDGRVSAWVKPSNTNRGDFAGQWPAYMLKWSLSGHASKFRMQAVYPTNSFAQSPSTYSTGVWRYIVGDLDFSTTETTLYVNGALTATSTGAGSIVINNQPFSIGAEFGNFSYNAFSGVVDEVRISTAILSSDWEASEYTNQSDPEGFYSVGVVE
jgi:hypothetical protein